MIKLHLEEYLDLSKKFDYIPVWTELSSDATTPVRVYQKIRNLSSYSFILESVQQHEKLGRYSYIGFDPLLSFRSKGKKITISEGESKSQVLEGNPFDELFRTINGFQLAKVEALKPYCGDAVGYFGYDTIRHIENIPDANADDLNLEESIFVFPKNVILFDHITQSIKVIYLAPAGDEKAYRSAVQALESLLEKIFQQEEIDLEIPYLSDIPEKEPIFQGNITKEDFITNIGKAKEYIRNGDIFQVVLSQRFEMPFKQDPFLIYRSLRRINPSPYLFYFNFPDFQIAGSSPEILVKKIGDVLTLRPIAGTRKRGKTKEEDEKLTNELLADPKEIAEHMMLVDLGRNDLGKISQFGSVKPTLFKQVENYSHVKHIVTNLESRIESGISASEVFKAAFPAGTLTGAPKIRAMEIIDELETSRRGFYGGTVANIDFSGNIDACIAIRSVVIKNDKAFIQAGAGIVADSDPEMEYQECLNKAKAIMKAIQIVGEK